jgi:hypothetical protein
MLPYNKCLVLFSWWWCGWVPFVLEKKVFLSIELLHGINQKHLKGNDRGWLVVEELVLIPNSEGKVVEKHIPYGLFFRLKLKLSLFIQTGESQPVQKKEGNSRQSVGMYHYQAKTALIIIILVKISLSLSLFS